MITETWKGWAIAQTREDGREEIYKWDWFLSIHPDQAGLILRKMQRENPELKLRIAYITVEIQERPHEPRDEPDPY